MLERQKIEDYSDKSCLPPLDPAIISQMRRNFIETIIRYPFDRPNITEINIHCRDYYSIDNKKGIKNSFLKRYLISCMSKALEESNLFSSGNDYSKYVSNFYEPFVKENSNFDDFPNFLIREIVESQKSPNSALSDQELQSLTKSIDTAYKNYKSLAQSKDLDINIYNAIFKDDPNCEFSDCLLYRLVNYHFFERRNHLPPSDQLYRNLVKTINLIYTNANFELSKILIKEEILEQAIEQQSRKALTISPQPTEEEQKQVLNLTAIKGYLSHIYIYNTIQIQELNPAAPPSQLNSADVLPSIKVLTISTA